MRRKQGSADVAGGQPLTRMLGVGLALKPVRYRLLWIALLRATPVSLSQGRLGSR
jgi:hypothetical protein